MTKAKHCDECLFFTYQDDQEPKCDKGHRLRFYAPKTISQAQRNDFGYKRRCEDFMLDDKQV